MKILLMGATGTTGRLLLDRALAAGDHVTAYARDPAGLPPRDGLTAVGGDVRDARRLAEVAAGTDVVISTLGVGTSRTPEDLITATSRSLTEAARAGGVRRVIMMSAFGVGESLPKASRLARVMYGMGGRATFADKAAGEALLRAADLDLTLVYPVLLTDGPATDGTAATDLDALTRVPGLPRVSRADVAAFLHQEAHEPRWTGRTVVLAPAR